LRRAPGRAGKSGIETGTKVAPGVCPTFSALGFRGSTDEKTKEGT